MDLSTNVYGKTNMFGYLDKANSFGISSLTTSSSYRSRYFLLDDGKIEYYSKEPTSVIQRLSDNDRSSTSSSSSIDNDLLGYMDLTGSVVSINNNEITITGPQSVVPTATTTTTSTSNTPTTTKYTIDKLKPEMILRVSNPQEALAWYECIQKNIDNNNIEALRSSSSSSRQPEVFEWYYRYQNEINKRTALLENEQCAEMHYTLPIKTNTNTTNDNQWKVTSLP